jgi:hypothetical protein
MRLIPLTVALVALTSPAVAQGVTQRDGTEQQSSQFSSHGPTTDVICGEEISATFCNVVAAQATAASAQPTIPKGPLVLLPSRPPFRRVGISGPRPNNAIKPA